MKKTAKLVTQTLVCESVCDGEAGVITAGTTARHRRNLLVWLCGVRPSGLPPGVCPASPASAGRNIDFSLSPLSDSLQAVSVPEAGNVPAPATAFTPSSWGQAFRPAGQAALLLSLLLLSSCGYHIAGTTNLLPTTVHTIAVPPFGNGTTVYKVTDMLSEAVTREFISRTKYHITADRTNADATLEGYVTQVSTFPTVYDPVTFRAANVEVHVNLHIKLLDKSGKVLFERNGMDVRERYEVSVDPKVYFDESEMAMQRLSRDLAKTVVSAILENF